MPNDKFCSPEEEIFEKIDSAILPKVDEYDLKLRKIDYLERNELKDLDSALQQRSENFFIKIPGYGKNEKWARFMAQSANYAALLIENSESFDNVLAVIAKDCSDWKFSNVRYAGDLAHPASSVEPALRYSKEIYEDLTTNYMHKKLTKADIKDVNKKIASIHWLLAHGTPYLRGSDSITNTFIKSLYSALGFKMSPPKNGVSFDLEAFSSEYSDFVKKYTSLYENEPEYLC